MTVMTTETLEPRECSMTTYTVISEEGAELYRTATFDDAFIYRAQWNCAHAYSEPAPICQVYENTPPYAPRLIDRVAMIRALSAAMKPEDVWRREVGV
jgi:hypothetical protein